MTTNQEEPDVIVYVSDGSCVQCDATKRKLDKYGIAYTVKVCYDGSKAQAVAKSYGYVQSPVVVTSDDHWSGFRDDKIKLLATNKGLLEPKQKQKVPAAV